MLFLNTVVLKCFPRDKTELVPEAGKHLKSRHCSYGVIYVSF